MRNNSTTIRIFAALSWGFFAACFLLSRYDSERSQAAYQLFAALFGGFVICGGVAFLLVLLSLNREGRKKAMRFTAAIILVTIAAITLGYRPGYFMPALVNVASIAYLVLFPIAIIRWLAPNLRILRSATAQS